MKQITLSDAGPGSRRNWTRLNEHQVGRPVFRAKKNPTSSATLANGQGTASPQYFPYAGIGASGENLEIVAWSLRDSIIALAAAGKVWNTLTYLFTSGQNTPLLPIGGTTAFNKPDLLCNINSNTGQLANPQSFLVTRIQQIIRNDVYQQDLLNIAFSTLYQFLCGDLNRPYMDEPGAKVPCGAAGIFVGSNGSGSNIPLTGIAQIGWPVIHNELSMQTGLLDPSLADAANPNGKPDMGIVINQGRQFKFTLDPTQFAFNGATPTQGSWTTIAAASGGTGFQLSIELVGNLARSLAG
jgi:hypothetical protein